MFLSFAEVVSVCARAMRVRTAVFIWLRCLYQQQESRALQKKVLLSECVCLHLGA